MAKFETVKTLMYQFLISELEEDIRLANQRFEILEESKCFDDAIDEQKQIIKWEEQLRNLNSYLDIEEKCTSNRPSYIEISYFDEFANKKVYEELNTYQLDGEEYYLKSTGLTLKDWKSLQDGVLYLVGNLTIKIVEGVLLSKYPHETMWYVLDEELAFEDQLVYYK